MKKKLAIIGSAVVGGLLFNLSHIPVGAMVGATFGTGIAQVVLNSNLVIPVKVKRLIRISMGTFVGLGITAEGVSQIRTLLFPALLVIIGVCILSLLGFQILHKIFKLDFAEAVFSTVPAGLSEIAVSIEGLKVDPAMVSLIHFFRLTSVEVGFPLLLKIFQFI